MTDPGLIDVRQTIGLAELVPPGSTENVTFEVSNNADSVLPTDPDACSRGFAKSPGTEVRLDISIDGSRLFSDSVCIPSNLAIEDNTVVFNAQIDFPEDVGIHTAKYEFYLPGTNKRVKVIEEQVELNDEEEIVVDKGVGETTEGPETGGKFLDFAMENPLLTTVGVGAGLVVLKSATEEVI